MDHTHDIKSEVRRYLLIFGALMFLTIVTVAVSYLNVEVHLAVTIALIVATMKGSLVCLFFMHLISEKKFIYVLLTNVTIFLIAMVWLFVGGYYNTPHGTEIPKSDQRSAVVHDSHLASHNQTSTVNEKHDTKTEEAHH